MLKCTHNCPSRYPQQQLYLSHIWLQPSLWNSDRGSRPFCPRSAPYLRDCREMGSTGQEYLWMGEKTGIGKVSWLKKGLLEAFWRATTTVKNRKCSSMFWKIKKSLDFQSWGKADNLALLTFVYSFLRILSFHSTWVCVGQHALTHICSSPLSFLFLVVKFKIYMPRLVEQFEREKKHRLKKMRGTGKIRRACFQMQTTF